MVNGKAAGLVLAGVIALAGAGSIGRAPEARPVFAFAVPSGREELTAVLFAGSLRRFGGALAEAEVWALAPEPVAESVSPPTRARLEGLNVRLLPFRLPDEARTLPLGQMPYAAAAAEERAAGAAETLVWLDSDTLILREPAAFRLPPGKSLAFRPVMHLLIGSRFEAPIDPFWSLIYRACEVPGDHVFPMTTPVDRVRIRPYFNAGQIPVRPERGILRRWRDDFDRIMRGGEARAFFDKDPLYAVFLPQAVLAGAILNRLAPSELAELPADYNYSLQLHARYPEENRARSSEAITTARYDRMQILAETPDWRSTLALAEPFRSWLDGELDILGIRVLLHASPMYGANYFPNRDLFEENGWIPTLAGLAGEIQPCAFLARYGVGPLRPAIKTDRAGAAYPFRAVALVPASSQGSGAPFADLIASPPALEALRSAAGAGIPLLSICSGVRVLAAAGLVRGRRVVGEPKFQAEVEAAGGVFFGQDHPPVVDGPLVTGARDLYYDFANVLALSEAIERRFPRGGGTRPGAFPAVFEKAAALRPDGAEWALNIGGGGSDGFRAVVPAPDGGSVAAGYTFSNGRGDADMLVVKADRSGRTVWARTFGGAGFEYANGLARVAGGYLAVGSTTSFGAGSKDVHVVRLDEDGGEMWSRSFGGPSWDAGAAAAVSGGGFFVAGYTASSGGGEEDFILLRLSPEGSLLWSKTYGGTRSEIAAGMAVLPDGGCVIAGTSGTFGGDNNDFWVVRVDADGQELWRRGYGTAFDGAASARTPFDWCRSLAATPDGGFVLAGMTNSRDIMDALVVKLDGRGETVWTRTLSWGAFYDFGCAVAARPDGSLALAGVVKSASGDNDIVLAGLAANGEPMGSQRIEGRGRDWAGALAVTADGAILAAGQTSTGGMMGSTDAWLARIGRLKPEAGGGKR